MSQSLLTESAVEISTSQMLDEVLPAHIKQDDVRKLQAFGGLIVDQEFENSINKSGPSMGEASRPETRYMLKPTKL